MATLASAIPPSHTLSYCANSLLTHSASVVSARLHERFHASPHHRRFPDVNERKRRGGCDFRRKLPEIRKRSCVLISWICRGIRYNVFLLLLLYAIDDLLTLVYCIIRFGMFSRVKMLGSVEIILWCRRWFEEKVVRIKLSTNFCKKCYEICLLQNEFDLIVKSTRCSRLWIFFFFLKGLAKSLPRNKSRILLGFNG